MTFRRWSGRPISSPEGEYGGGTVMVWDIGTYALIEGNYWKGELHFHLNSKKLKGEWLLKKTGSQTAGRIDSIS
jgi:hypothetical protein